MADDKTTTESVSPALKTLDQLSDAELSKFELDGSLPTVDEKAGTSAEAAAALVEEPAQPVSTETKTEAATEAAKPATVKKPGQKKSAGERAEEIERETAAEEDRLRKALAKRSETRRAREEAEREEPSPKSADKTAEAAAAAKDPAWKKYRNMPDAPKSDDFESLDDYSAAMGYFIAEKIADEKANAVYETRSGADREAVQQDQQFVDDVERAEVSMKAELTADPEIMSRIDDRWKGLNPSSRLGDQPMTIAHFVKDEVMFRSSHPLKLSEWLTANDSAELKRIGRLSPPMIIREIAKQDARFDEASDETQATAGARQHPHVSTAPAPAPVLGKKATPAKDPLKAPNSYDDFDNWNLEVAKATSPR